MVLRQVGLRLAVWLALVGLGVSLAAADAPGALHIEAIRDALPYRVEGTRPVTLLMDRARCPELDGYLEGIVWLDGGRSDKPQSGRLEVTLSDGQGGQVLARHVAEALPGSRLRLAVPMPQGMAGRSGGLTVRWLNDQGQTRGSANAPWEIMPAEAPPARQGQISLGVPNPDGLHVRHWPVTVGVPFPQGTLDDVAHLSLRDAQGRVIPLQARVTAKWSRHGSIKWALLDFAVDLQGQPLALTLHYGPDAATRQADIAGRPLKVTPAPWPEVDADHYWIDAHGLHLVAQGHARKLLSRQALLGGYVVHENGKTYAMPEDTPLTVEHAGPQKVVLKAAGWYTHADSGERFCQFIVRYELTHRSALLKLHHTWVYTGDAYEDRIADIGWRFGLADGLTPQAFPASFDVATPALSADALVQRDDERFDVLQGDGRAERAGRLPGVMVARGAGVDLAIGVRDFWQNYPAELERQPDALVYHLWPAHGRDERREPTPDNAMRLWFAHEGKLLDFALPVAYTQKPIIDGIPSSRRGSRAYTLEGIYKQRANPQGVAKSTEFWFIATPSAESMQPTLSLLQALQDYTLSATVDPAWIAQSGAMGLMHPQDLTAYPMEESLYLLHALAPRHWQEQTHIHGKWIWGCMPSAPLFEERRIGLHRGLRKSHHGWPYSWTPFARTGDVRLLQLADAGTRYQCDVAFIHYSDEKLGGRPRGWYTRFPIPWADNRPYPQVRNRESKADYLWQSHYLTGYARALDVALDFADLIKYSGSGLASPHDDQTLFERVGGDDSRSSVEMLQTYLDMYEATFDPWFIAAAHQIARVQLDVARADPAGVWAGHFEGMGIRRWDAFHGSDEYRRRVALPYVRYWGSQHTPVESAWALVTPMLEPRNLAYELTGDAQDAGVIRGALDEMVLSTFAGEPAYLQGFRAPPGSNNEWGPSYTGYLLRDLPVSLALLARARQRGLALPDMPNDFMQAPSVEAFDEATGLATMRWTVHFVKEADRPLPLALRVGGSAKWAKDESAAMQVVGPDGKAWLTQHAAGRQLQDQSLPAHAPAGAYRLEVTVRSNIRLASSHLYRPTLRLPVTPPGTPEVYQAHRDKLGRVHVGPSHHTARYWVPRPTDLSGEWRVTFLPVNMPGRLSVMTLGTSDRLWLSQRHHLLGPADRKRPLALAAPMADLGQAAFLSVAQAGVSAGFTLDAAFSPYLAVAPGRWFAPPPESDARK